MNILVIGNGFDLAHGLPTTYKDFLLFTSKYKDFLKEPSNKQILEMKGLVNDNTWLRHFCSINVNGNWIDFEKEISNIIKLMDDKIPQFESIRKKGIGGVKFYPSEREILKDFDLTVSQGIIHDTNFLFKFRDCVLSDLNKLIRCLEIYLTCYINKYSVSKISLDIAMLDIDKVLSFNYTDTYARIYNSRNEKNIEYDYIHGKADVNHTIETNNMVLGIDEHLPDDRKNVDIEFIAFKKYYQRIYKQTGNKYKSWVDIIKKEYEDFLQISAARTIRNIATEYPQHNLYIFGHSLDVTDKDILCDLILNDNVHTTIFYHNKETMGRQIANLVKVIGQDELIRRTGGSTKTIEFKLQQDMVNRR